MSSSSIRLDRQDKFRVLEAGNYQRADVPVDDSTEIAIQIGEDVHVWLSVGQWRAMVAAVERGIEAIPADRAGWRALMERTTAAQSGRAAVSA